ncbi:unnamed protein product [Adineta steineri]|uniref:Uncharacterized protein n=2 Tax=Adineta steineri TaxID=433720 RepID=A0A814R412_9BILA|nr:unnamed protein product [Adineta steineri]
MIQLVNNLCLQVNPINYTYCLEHILPLVRFDNIKTLSFYNNSKSIQTTSFFLFYSLKKFTELRSFTFHNWYLPLHNSRELIEQLLYLTHLEKLDVTLIDSPSNEDFMDNDDVNNTRLINLIFSSNHNLRTSLKHLVLDMYIGEQRLHNIRFLPTNLEYFEVNVIDLKPFLTLIPSLELRCKTILFKYLEVNNGYVPPSSSLKVLNYCTKLTFKTNCYFQFNHLQVFLSCFPEVKQLTIDNSSSDETLTAEELELLLRNQCSKLLKFQYVFNTFRLSNIQHNSASYWQTFKQSKFWQNHNFTFRYDDDRWGLTILEFDLR